MKHQLDRLVKLIVAAALDRDLDKKAAKNRTDTNNVTVTGASGGFT